MSVETTQQAWSGQCRHGGRAWAPKGPPEPVEGPAFPEQEWGKGMPSGVYAMVPTRAGSVWESITLRPRAPENRAGAGGLPWAAPSIRVPSVG